MSAIEVAESVCELVGAPTLLHWLELAPDASGPAAQAALKARRRKLQSLQGSPKHASVARLVIKHQHLLLELLDDPSAYLRTVEHRRAEAQLPLLDIGVDGVLADGTVTAGELAFLRATARRLGVDPALVLGRLEQRAEAQGVRLHDAVPALPPVEGPRHPLLPRGWLDEGVASWLLAELGGGPTLVDAHGDEGGVACALSAARPGLVYVGFAADEAMADRAEQAFAVRGHGAASMLPSDGYPLPLSDGMADAVLFVFEGPDANALADARRVAGLDGRVVAVTVGVPRVTCDGPVPALDAALWGLCRVARARAPLLPARSASVHVMTRTVVGPRDRLVALLLHRVAAVQACAGLSDAHPAVRRLGSALESFGGGPEGLASYEVPLVAQQL